MVTVGYGDITPKTTDERIYTMLAMIVASGMFSYTLNSIGTIIMRYNILATNYKEKMNHSILKVSFISRNSLRFETENKKIFRVHVGIQKRN